MSISDKVLAGSAGFGLFSWVTNKLYGNMTDSAYNKYARVYAPAGIVSIVIPAFNEEDYIETTLKSILSQNIIFKHTDYFECIVVDNDSTDRTAEIAKQYCQVIFAPRGKLNARHRGVKHASGDIIVSCDADCYYPPNWLNLLIRHFHKPEVVAVAGSVLPQGNMLNRLATVWRESLIHKFKRTIHGANSAFLKDTYLKVNGFDLSIDQFDLEEMLMEEQYVFLGKLRHFGKVIFDLQACCFALRTRGGHRTVIEQRLNGEYYKEIARGERF